MRSDVIEKMLEAWHSGPSDDALSMTAAAKVLLDEVLGPVTDEEYKPFYASGHRQSLEWLFAGRRAKIEQPKTIEERVAIKTTPSGNHVELDGRHMFSCRRVEDAETYRLGLIAQLKSKEQQ